MGPLLQSHPVLTLLRQLVSSLLPYDAWSGGTASLATDIG